MSAAAAGIHLVRASAGCGKTTRLTREIVSALGRSPRGHVAVDHLMAMTYTRKAAAELTLRMHRGLVAAGRGAEAARLPLAYVGTIHAVCLRLLEEHAIDAGLPPSIEVLPAEEAQLLRQAMERCIPDALRTRMDELAGRLQISWDARTQRHDWLRPVSDVMELARSNRVRPPALAEMARRSAESLLALLPAPAPSGDALEAALVTEIGRADRALAGGEDGTAATRVVREELAGAMRKAGQGALSWSDWLRLSRLRPSRRSIPAVQPLVEAASAVERHPQLHRDLLDFTTGVFDAARAGLEGHATWKAERCLLDYTDMIDLGLELAEHAEVSSELSSRLGLVAVDELQDTTPLQLALLIRLHRLVGRTILVGDSKQCIFEYAGADPLLMDAVNRWVCASGGTADTLAVNHRSRPELVAVANQVFGPAFGRFDAAEVEARVDAARTTPAEQASLPPLGVFWLHGARAAEDAAAVADGVVRLLRRPSMTPVVCPASGELRPVQPGDVAILTATNAEARRIAHALEERRIATALARPGLLATPEGTLLESALRWLLDPSDSLAEAVIDALTGWAGGDPDTYLAARLAARRRDGEVRAAAQPLAAGTWRGPLDQVRGRLDRLSPSEVAIAALAALDAPGLCARWPAPDQRLGNLDALLALTGRYERRAARLREPATLRGLVAHLVDARRLLSAGDAEGADDEQHVLPGDHTVSVSTYHRAKGLEWPVVILTSLDRGGRRSAFDAAPETDRLAFEPDDPLGGRWIRYWPWPFGPQRCAPLAAAAAASPEGRRVREHEDRERLRLLYVGFTRARDHLVLAVRRKEGRVHARWLDELATDDGPLIQLPVAATDGSVAPVRAGSSSAPARVWAIDPAPARPVELRTAARRFRRAAPPGERPAYRIAPSRADTDWPDLGGADIGEVVPLAPGPALRRAGAIDWESAGRALHAFFAADPDGLASGERIARATRILEQASLAGHLSPDRLVCASDSLRSFITARWPGAATEREIPITAFLPSPHGRRRIEGIIDLLVDTGDTVAVIDHKSFPAWSEAASRSRARDLAPQLVAYGRALSLLGRRVASLWFHFPLASLMVEVLARETRP